MPERLIGAVLKTVVRSRVPWVRIPPPPPFRKSLKRLFFSAFLTCPRTQKMSKFCKKGTKKGLLKNFVDFRGFQRLSKTQYYISVFAVNAVNSKPVEINSLTCFL